MRPDKGSYRDNILPTAYSPHQALIPRIAKANPWWSHNTLHGELLRLHLEIGHRW